MFENFQGSKQQALHAVAMAEDLQVSSLVAQPQACVRTALSTYFGIHIIQVKLQIS